MSRFVIKFKEDGTVSQIYKDGYPHNEAVKLEQLFSVVKIYFELCRLNLKQMAEQSDDEGRRYFGIQSFLMSLTGLEAFTNTFFHLRGEEVGSGAILRRVAQSHCSLSKKIKELTELSPDGPLVDEDMLLDKVFALSRLRNEIVHPRWEPSSLLVDGHAPVSIRGLVYNSQAAFEDMEFCDEAFTWCLLVIARIGQARGSQDVSGFMFHWTGMYGLTLPMILGKLGLQEDQ